MTQNKSLSFNRQPTHVHKIVMSCAIIQHGSFTTNIFTEEGKLKKK